MGSFIQKILLATDLSECSEGAFQYASMIGQKFNARVDVIHVLEFQPGMDESSPVAKIYFDAYWKKVGPDLDKMMEPLKEKPGKADCIQKMGKASEVINQCAFERGADLVVLGTHGWSGLDRVLLGSTAERVIRGAPCPVVTVRWTDDRSVQADNAYLQERQETAAPGQVSFKRMLIPLDFSDGSIEAMEYGAQVAKQCSTSVDLLHVVEPPGYGLDFTLIHPYREKMSRSDIESRLGSFSGVFQAQGIKTEHSVTGGIPPDAILNYVRDRSIDLIVMGTHGRRGVSRWVSGSVAEAVLRHAPCPVITVKSPRFAKGHPRFSSR